MPSSSKDHLDGRSHLARYRSLRQRLVVTNAALLVAACLLTVFVLAPRKFSSFAVDEAAIVLVALILVTLINVVVVHRFLAPLQALTALARVIDLDKPGQRIHDAQPTSETGELAVTFNEMLERLELERREAARQVLAAHESERLRIAQELHDEVGQTLTALLLQLSRVEAHLPEDLRGELSEAQEAARTSLEDVRRIATDLRPEALNDWARQCAGGTRRGIRSTYRTARRTAIQTPMPRLHGEAELVLYRVAQEALTNVARHSGSDTAKVTVESDANRLMLTIRDHGRGFPEGHTRSGNGIRGMRERADLIGADLRIDSPSDGPGTELCLELPLNGGPCNA